MRQVVEPRALPPRKLPPVRREGESDEEFARRRVEYAKAIAAMLDAERHRRLRLGDGKLGPELYDASDELVRPTEERSQHDRVARLEKPIADDKGAIARPHKAEDTLGRMHRAKTITDAMYAAGCDFRSAFRMAQLDALRAADAGRIPGVVGG